MELIAGEDAAQRSVNNLSGAEMPFPASTGPPSHGIKAQILDGICGIYVVLHLAVDCMWYFYLDMQLVFLLN